MKKSIFFTFVSIVVFFLSCTKENLKPEQLDVNNFTTEVENTSNRAPDIRIWMGIWDGNDIETSGLGCKMVRGVCFVEVVQRTAEYPFDNDDLPAIVVIDNANQILLPNMVVQDTTDNGRSYQVLLDEV